MIYVIMSVYMLCLVPKMFSLVQIAQAGTLFAFVLPYILACIFFAMTCSIFIHHREACMMIYVFTSVPLLFISGISWPVPPFLSFGKLFHGYFPPLSASTALYESIIWGLHCPMLPQSITPYGYKRAFISSLLALSIADR